MANLNGRCVECVADRRYAMNRVLELVRTEPGQYRLLLEYLGITSTSLKHSVRSVMDHVGVGALIEA